MMDQFNIATWNLCLGLSNKKDYVEKVMNENSIDICCMQEVEIGTNIDTSLLSMRNYSLLIENNELKARTGLYVKNGTIYTRKEALEGVNAGLIILDLKLKIDYRIISIYRSFNPPGVETQREMFSRQLALIKTAVINDKIKKIILLGDFNLDENKRYMHNYSHKLYFKDLNSTVDPFGMIQLVDFNTWSRLVNGAWRYSIIDHVYTTDETLITVV